MGMIGLPFDGSSISFQLFVHDLSKVPTLEALVYEVGVLLQLMIFIFWIYTRYPIKDLPVKILLLTGILTTTKTIIDLIVNDNKGSVWYYDVSLWLLLVGFVIYKINSWTIRIKTQRESKIEEDGVYAIVTPNIGFAYLCFITKFDGIIQKWEIKIRTGRLTPNRLTENYIVRNRIVEKLPIYNIKGFIDNLKIISEDEKARWTRFKSNCLTMIKPALEEHSISVKTWNPSIWIKNYQKNKDAIKKTGNQKGR